MGLASFWSSITAPRVREITPPKNRGAAPDRRPATSSGVRTVRRTPSLEEDGAKELNQVESLLTTNIIEPPSATEAPFEEKKTRRRSRGLSLSRSKNEDGLKRRRSVFGGGKDVAKKEEVPEVPTLPTLSAIYSRQAPHQLGEVDRPSTAISAVAVPPSAKVKDSNQGLGLNVTQMPYQARKDLPNVGVEVFELPAELPAAPVEAAAETDVAMKKSRRRSLGKVLSGKRPKSFVLDGSSYRPVDEDAPPTPALPAMNAPMAPTTPIETVPKNDAARSRRNSNASVASKVSRLSRKSKRKSWWQRGKDKDDESELLPPLPSNPSTSPRPPSTDAPRGRKPASPPTNVDLSAFPPAPKKPLDDDAASIRTTRSEKATARSRSKSLQRRQSTASHVAHRRHRRRSWWASSNPDDSDSDPDTSPPLPPVPLLIRSTRTTPDSSPTNSDDYFGARAGQPVSVGLARARTYTPRSAAKSFLVSTAPIPDGVRASVRRSLHAGFEGGERGTYCLSAEQQREWEKLKHLMAVMERRRDVTRQTFGEGSVEEAFPVAPGREVVGADEEREGVKYSNGVALAALGVGVAK